MNKEYLQSKEEVLKQHKSSLEGLSSKAAAELLEKNGFNKLEEGKKKTLIQKCLDQIKDPMIIVLIVAGLVSGIFGEVVDMAIILIVVILNGILGIFQEGKAEKAIESLQNMSAPTSKVRRDGKILVIPSKEIVIGDIVILEAGDSIPADIRLLSSASMKVEEAALTGESVPVDKQVEALKDTNSEVPLGDRTNMAYLGTNVTYGRGEGVVVGTAMNTEMGKIANILTESKEEKTPLQKRLADLSKILSAGVLGICVFIFIFTLWRTNDYSSVNIFESLLIAVSLAVAAIPEGLVVVVTVLLSIGVTKMSTKNAIIRRLTAVETLGCTEVICSDKTGTLTQNKMTVVDNYGDQKLLALVLSNCNDTQVDPNGKLIGDPTETALVDYANKLNIIDRPERIEEAPFDSDRKMMSTIHNVGKTITQYTKGAPDEVLKKCTSALIDGKIVKITDKVKNEIIQANKSMADKALRVLAGAYKEYSKLPADNTPSTLEKDLIFVGLVGMIDPIRPEVKLAIEECKTAGIRAVMITGDHKDTAIAIAKDLGILTDVNQAITGAELSELSDEEFEKRIHNLVVYARVQPEHKVRIVKMWRKIGKITAMTGDGVNDAPALKSADIGVGMGITGTDVTKNVSDMVLADDNFASIVYAVEEGRRIYENIRKAIQFLLASNLSEVISIFIATILGWKLFAPIHILWINLVTDTFPAMALGMEEAEEDIMEEKPRSPKESIFADGLGIAVIWQGIVVGILTLISFSIGFQVDGITGMTMAFFTLSMCEIFHSINLRSRTKSIFKMHTHNRYLTVAMLVSFVLTLIVIYTPGINTAFQLTPLSIEMLAIAIVISVSIIPIVEIVKAIQRKING